MSKIEVMDTEISIQKVNGEDYISLTDMAKSQMQEHIIFKWLSTKSTLEYVGEWETIYNPDFNCTEFGIIKNSAGSNNFVLSTKQWILQTNAKGIIAKTGRYGGTYAHRDIAYHFGMWISPRFQLLLVKEYQRLKAAEQAQLGWSVKRELSKINYRIHTDAIKQNLIPAAITPQDAAIVYASEADVLNKALFGFTAAQWREANPMLVGNVRRESLFHALADIILAAKRVQIAHHPLSALRTALRTASITSIRIYDERLHCSLEFLVVPIAHNQVSHIPQGFRVQRPIVIKDLQGVIILSEATRAVYFKYSSLNLSSESD